MNMNTMKSLQDAVSQARTLNDRANALNAFKAFAIGATGWQGHPKAEKAFGFAYAYGHANGLQDVFSLLEDLRVLVD